MAISSFIGREEEAARLRELVASCRMVTVVGVGGIGKTRLATEVVAQIAEAFPGGIHRTELAPITARTDIAVEVASDLGFASLDALALGLAEDRGLLVLDNCEHVLAATAELCGELLRRCPSLHLLATSREPLEVDGEHLLALGPLRLPDASDAGGVAQSPAVRLYTDRARAAGARPDGSAQLGTVAELCRRLDGIPLAIELAAARARSLTPGEMLVHLDRRFDLLRRSAPVGTARHASLRAAIDTSYALLEPEEQFFFRRLGIFAGAFDAALAHALAEAAGADQLHSIDLLSRLVDRSLVVAEPHAMVLTRYHLLDSLRHYSMEQAAAAGEAQALRTRFVDVMIAEADRVVSSGLARWTAAVLTRVRLHFANWTAAIESCLETDATAERALRILLPMWGMVHQGKAGEIASLCDRIGGRWPSGDEPLRAEAAAVAASAYLVAGRPDSAIALGNDTLARAAASLLARVLALRTLALAARHGGDLDGAVAFFREARDIARAADLKPFERELDVFVASILGVTGELDPALAVLDEVATHGDGDGDAISQVWARLVQAQILLHAERGAEARAALRAAQHLQRDIEYPYGQNLAARLHAILTTRESGWASTRGLWRAAIDAIVATGDLGELGATLRAAAALAAAAGDREAAEALRASIPVGPYVTVLGDALPSAAGLDSVSVSAGAAGSVAGLHRVRELLARDPLSSPRGSAAPRPDPSAGPAADAPLPTEAPAAELRRVGDGWTIRFAGRSSQIRHLKGLEDLVVLLSRPGDEVHCLELMGPETVSESGIPGLDERARRDYRARVRDLQEEIDEARGHNDPLRAERLEAELDALVQQLSSAFGLSGRERPTASSVERARSAVTWRLRTAIKRVQEVHPELGRHLLNAIRTGTWCSYQPERALEWSLDAADARPRGSRA